MQAGFTLIELLVTMIIIGVLAAIAIPVLLTQRAKAYDTATKADLATLGKEVINYFVDGKGTLSLNYGTSPRHVVVSDGSYAATLNLSEGTVPPATGASAGLSQPQGWCVSLTNPRGADQTYKYSYAGGLTSGSC